MQSRVQANGWLINLSQRESWTRAERLIQPSVNDDAELLARIRGGATDDFAEIVQRHQSRVFAILYRYERDAQRLEDLAQETFIKAWRALAQYDGRAPFAHWLSRIAVHVALDHLRREKRHQNQIGLPELGEDALDWLRNDADDARIEARDAAELLHLALRELPALDRVTLTLLELEGRSVEETSRTMGITSVAVRVRAFRARRKLKGILEKMAKGKP